jgi:hypothetical protein
VGRREREIEVKRQKAESQKGEKQKERNQVGETDC